MPCAKKWLIIEFTEIKVRYIIRLTIALFVSVVILYLFVFYLFTKNHILSDKNWVHITQNSSREPNSLGDSQSLKDNLPAGNKKKQVFILDPLPQSVINGIKTFVFFLGHSRSGSSIVASLLDAHPHIVIAHEIDIFEKILNPTSYESIADKSLMFNTIWRNSYYSFRKGHRRSRDAKKGYTLQVEGQYQGAYQSYIRIIGDKKAGKTARLLASNHTEWNKVFKKLRSVVGIPIKVFHCIRNPYDNIATMIIDDAVNHGSLNYTTIGKVRVSHENYTFDSKEIEDHIDEYFENYKAVDDVKSKLDILQIHNYDLIVNPRKAIREMCDFLRVSCSENYLDTCAHKVFKVLSKSRYRIVWENHHLSKIKTRIKKFNDLQRYIEFDS